MTENIINFWARFFPEKNERQIGEILKKISNLNLKDIIEKRLEKGTIFATDKFFLPNQLEFVLEQDFNETVNMICKDIKWIKFCEPILRFYFKRIYMIINNSKIVKDKKDFLIYTMHSLSSRLFIIYCKTLVLEFHIAKKNGILNGGSSTEKANYFNIDLLSNTRYLKLIYTFYPELIRLLDINVSNFTQYLQEILEGTERELKNLKEIFGSLGYLLRIDFGMGDSHNNGKSVAKLIFEKNRLIYKPKNLKIEMAYCKFLSWINRQKIPNTYDLNAGKVYYSKNQGWMEYIENVPCDNEKDVYKFYVRIGQLLCILYTLRANDFHYENLISRKDYPILIDLETLIGNNFFQYNISQNLVTQAHMVINESVLKAALLPSKVVNPKNNKFIDIGGVSFAKPQKFPFSSYVVERIETDEVKIVKKFTKSSICANNPTINGNVVISNKYINQIEYGFRTMYKWIQENKKSYIKSIINIFNECEYRTILKSTNFYFQLINMSYHPDLLQNSIDRLVFLHRVALVHDTNNSIYNQISFEEIQQLYAGDVPYFTSTPNSNFVYTLTNNKKFRIHKSTAFNSISEQINNMSKIDLSYQNFFIRASFKLSSNDILKSVIKKLYLQRRKDI